MIIFKCFNEFLEFTVHIVLQLLIKKLEQSKSLHQRDKEKIMQVWYGIVSWAEFLGGWRGRG